MGPIGYLSYQEAVEAGVAGFHQIEERLCVVRQWDVEKKQCADSWFHLTFQRVGSSLLINCRCRVCKTWDQECVHKTYLRIFEEERFRRKKPWPDIGMSESTVKSAELTEDAAKLTILLLRDTVDERSFVNLFSIGIRRDKNRAIVTHYGGNNGSGNWHCDRGCGHNPPCIHVKHAQDQLQRIVQCDPNAVHDPNIAYGEETSFNDFDINLENENPSISYLPIMPPLWCRLPSDGILYPERPPLRDPPKIIPLEATARCKCGAQIAPETELEIIERPCTVYTLCDVIATVVQLHKCPVCPGVRRRRIGPDPRNIGLFNYNNSIMFSHELLDDYTSAFTASETPFVAWHTMMRRRISAIGKEFLSVEMFRSAWFAYVVLQRFENDMSCERCGPDPATVIWDGVSLSFDLKHLLESMAPPTLLQPDSTVRPDVRPFARTQCFPEKSTRMLLKKWLKGVVSDATAGEQAELASTLVQVSQLLGEIDKAVAAVFNFKLATRDERQGETLPFLPEYTRLFQQVSNFFQQLRFGLTSFQLNADESVLQMVTRPALNRLATFLQNPAGANVSELIGIPALYTVLMKELKSEGRWHVSLIGLCRWLHGRASQVLKTLMVHEGAPLERSAGAEEVPWTKTGCCYSMPQIRVRPKYPKLPWDQKVENSKNRGDKCSKYYSTYVEKTQTGGIMVAWCTHSICYGFHCIRKGEGRDDVFSAMVTRWKKAPQTVVYDFACALGPYCMLREPDFFADTQFVIDAFHSTGHTKCSAAAFVKTYAEVNPELERVNTSAAECGNGVLSRIRKSTSYMKQIHAVIYTKVFVSVVNQVKRRVMSMFGRK
ncbi:hypothetical protein C8J56DRAFT_790501 [Mycena floridula]|nr:hypothetical protein C8J56DRAFT_790501 [Mycena floridula]